MNDHLPSGGESYAGSGPWLEKMGIAIVISYVQYIQYKRKARKSTCEKHECISLQKQFELENLYQVISIHVPDETRTPMTKFNIRDENVIWS